MASAGYVLPVAWGDIYEARAIHTAPTSNTSTPVGDSLKHRRDIIGLKRVRTGVICLNQSNPVIGK
jgi:hypothetical protein